MKNFKKRWFRLTNHEFTYHKSKGKADVTLTASMLQEPCIHCLYMGSVAIQIVLHTLLGQKLSDV